MGPLKALLHLFSVGALCLSSFINAEGECGMPSGSHIYKRLESEPGARPWMAALYVNISGVNSLLCGGALVTDRHVVTAAHCVCAGRRATTLRASSFTVHLGDQNLLRNDGAVSAIDVPVSKVERHAEFMTRRLRNDVAVLTMQRPVTFNKFVKPVCLPYGDDFKARDLNGSYGFLTGWVTTKSNGNTSHVLKEAQIKTWDEGSCNEVFRLEASIASLYLCAGGNGRQATCPGDSGGVLLLPKDGRFLLVGVVSFGSRCATGDYPGLYTRVTESLPWLSERLQ